MNNTKIYTAFDYRVAAESCEKLSKSFLCGDERDRAIYADRAAMLRQAADDAEELTKAKRPDACPGNPTNKMCYLPGEYCCDTVRYLQKENAELKARLAAVKKEIEGRDWINDGELADAIIRAARGEGGAK